MEAFALYLFKSVVWLTGFALVYLLFLRNERYFVLNRIYLISGIVASILFPFFTWHYTIVIPFTPSIEVSDLQMTAVISEPETFPTKTILLYAYMTGALYLLYRIIRQTITVVGVIRNAEILPYRSAKLIRTAKYPCSFSFFSFVFVNPSSSETETREIVNHEMEHVRQKHWIDLVLFELLCTLQWLNPMVWLYGRFIRQNHEFLADQYALQRTQNPAIYRAALLNQLFGEEVISLANSFNYSINKKRFHMMKNTIQSPIRKLKLLVILPLIAGVFYAFAAPEYKYVQTGESSAQKDSITIFETRTITGKVVKEDGTPLNGASVVISGKTIGTITDNLGNFTLKVTDDSPIVISYVGFESQKTSPDFDKDMIIALKPVKIGIGEITVTGAYQGNSDQTPTGSTGKTTNTGMNEVTVTGAYQGNSAPAALGSSINLQTNSPLKFGNADGSVAKPLIVIDGVISENQNVNNIPPETIESISVLKDASATAAYGEKGKNGVVIITKKKDNKSLEKVPKDQKYTGVQFRCTDGTIITDPLIFIDGKPSDYHSLRLLKNDKVFNFNVLNIESAIKKYGDKGKNGAVEATIWKDLAKSKNSTIDVNIGQNANTQKNSDVYQIVEQMPEFPGGALALRKFIAYNIKYPHSAVERGIQGKEIVSFVITKTGSVADAKIVSGVDPSLDQEALRVVNSMPAWIPGKQGGKEVDVQYTVPINFALEGKPDVYTQVEQMPEFPGGEMALRKYLAYNIKYPHSAVEKGIQGKEFVSFVITNTGSVADAKIVRGVDPALDQEALRVVNSMPAWIPGKQGGKDVNVQYTLPINFVLEGKPEAKAGDNTAPYTVVEQMPEFPGGIEALKAFLVANIKYPAGALEKGIQGKVFVGFVITNTGNVTDAKVVRGVDPLLDQEALRVVLSMPSWIPGKQNGENVRVSYTIPVDFKLQSSEKTEASQPNVSQIGKLLIVPNPTKSKATVTLEGSDSTNKLQVSIIDNNGQMLKREIKNGPSFTISVSSLTPGTYRIVAVDGNKQYQGSLVVNR